MMHKTKSIIIGRKPRLDKDDYSRALIRSLWVAPNLAAVDFAGGRLRDFAQLWTDTARGSLGEIAVQKFLKNNFYHKKP